MSHEIEKRLLVFTSSVGDKDGWSRYSETIVACSGSLFKTVMVFTCDGSGNSTENLSEPSLNPRDQLINFWIGLKVIKRGDYVHVLVEPYAAGVLLAARIKRAKGFLTLHGTYALIDWSKGNRIKSIVRAVSFVCANALTAASDHTFEKLPSWLPLGSKYKISNIVLTQKFDGGKHREAIEEKWIKNPCFVTVGEVKERKGQLALVSAFVKFAQEYRNAELIILGMCSESSRQVIESVAQENKLSNRIHVLGRVNHDLLVYSYRSSLATILYAKANSNMSHGFPMIIHESNACGTPIILTRGTSDPKSVLESETGYWIDENDEEALLAAMSRIINMDEFKRRELRQKCINHAQKYGEGYLTGELSKLYFGG